ncbi:MAG: glycosyltransferase [Betaproteobacteria bacterium]|nr:glycosyltransferase [Betaproteobacteria bacterium]
MPEARSPSRQTPQLVVGVSGLQDIRITRNGRELHMLGSGGSKRELDMLEPCGLTAARLPVLLGSGMGYALRALLEKLPTERPLAVADKEEDILALTGLRAEFPHERITWFNADTPEECLCQLTHWQAQHGNLPMVPLAHPFYLRLDRAYYGTLRDKLNASTQFDFWSRAVRPRFRSSSPRLLLMTSKYFLMGEVVRACEQLEVQHYLLTLEDEEVARQDFVERLLKVVLDFKPDAILTLNHLGVDREGVLMDLLAQLHLPLASWFVDNPHLILHLYAKLVSPWAVIFTWDADNLPGLHELGFKHVFHLPLGTDPERFSPAKSANPPVASWRSQVSFVGNSMVYKVAKRMQDMRFPAALLRRYRELAAAFGESDERLVRSFLPQYSADMFASYQALPDNEMRLAYEAMITWEATRQYRTRCVRQILPFTPLIVGDRGWRQNFKRENPSWRLHSELSYYSELPAFYPWSDINFNCTSKQMKGAVNQRLFDVPAAGSFVLTDWRDQTESLFEPGKELIYYREPEEAPELIRYFLAHPEERRRIVQAARTRVLAEHTWTHRVQNILTRLREIYGT